MKLSVLFFLLLPTIIFAQRPTTSATLSGGVEYQDEQTHAWNLDVNVNRELVNFDRFWSEFGVNYSVLEYKGDADIQLDTTFPSLALGAIYFPGYVRRENTHYDRTAALRVSVGINYDVVRKEKIKLSAGVNVVNQILLTQREHGQRVFVPISEFDTLNLINTTYSSSQNLSTASNAISILLQPHLDARLAITEKLWFTTRLSYYWKVLPTVEHSRTQLNLGLRYEW